MKLVVGLGNPGDKYKLNRHNVGFSLLDAYAEANNLTFKKDKNSLIAIDQSSGTILLKPQTYMNNSGMEVKRVADYYKIEPQNILVIQDDKDILFSKYKLKMNSSAGGHNGVADIINYLGDAFLRLKIGIKNDRLVDTKDFVLGNFDTNERAFLLKNSDRYSAIIKEFAVIDNIELINKYNGDSLDI